MNTVVGLIGGLGTTELLIILAIVVLVFGVGKLPEVGRHLGRGIKNFKREMNDLNADVNLEDQSTPAEPVRDVTDEHTRV